jgi:hypothetical protein
MHVGKAKGKDCWPWCDNWNMVFCKGLIVVKNEVLYVILVHDYVFL